MEAISARQGIDPLKFFIESTNCFPEILGESIGKPWKPPLNLAFSFIQDERGREKPW